jgi:two-component system chemotaxis sensor kinase CheA
VKDEFLKRLLATFRIEADEHVSAMSSLLVEIEKTSDAQKRAEAIEAVLREAHSLKGAARAVNMTEIEASCQSVESVFVALKRKEIALSAELFDLLHETVDSLLPFLSAGEAGRSTGEKSKGATLIRKLEAAAKGGTAAKIRNRGGGSEEQKTRSKKRETRSKKIEKSGRRP